MAKKKTASKSKSTGPKTKQGKSIASRNATKHGLTAKSWLDTKEQGAYQSLLNALIEEYQQQTPTESLLVERIAKLATRLQRFSKVEDTLFAVAKKSRVCRKGIKPNRLLIIEAIIPLKDMSGTLTSFETTQRIYSNISKLRTGYIKVLNHQNIHFSSQKTI